MSDRSISVLIVDDERLARQKIRGLLQTESDVRVVGECSNGLEALSAVGDQQPDLMFLDVQMPDLDGLGVTAALSIDDTPEIVFVTAHNAYMEQAFEVHAIDYLRKPYSNERFYSALVHARRRIHERHAAIASPSKVADGMRSHGSPYGSVLADLRDANTDRRIALQDGRTGTWHIMVRDDIDWIGTDSSARVRVHIGKEAYVLRKTLVELEHSLDRRKFLRIHRSYIVNTTHIRQVKPLLKGEFAIVLTDGTVLDSGRTYREVIEDFLRVRAQQLVGIDEK
jgi:two-component system LytT family response regulator